MQAERNRRAGGGFSGLGRRMATGSVAFRHGEFHMNKTALGAIALAGSLSLGACATVEEAVGEALSTTHNATLTGTEVVGSRGETDGFAEAELSVSDETDQVCYDINKVRGLANITMVMIHRGARGVNGPAVFNLTKSNEGGYKGCTKKSEALENSFEYAPGRYYAQIHTVDFPKGAIRGQFRN